MFNHRKYTAFKTLPLTDRHWPDKQINKAPDWCSVDLRDGNQALINPMSIEQKTHFFQLLLAVGFKEIEVGFPSASQTDFDFVRKLIEEDLIPEHVTIQVLTQARTSLIQRTFEALSGVKRAIVHVYNSTSTVQREQVFALDREGIKNMALQGAKDVQAFARQYPDTDWTFQYSPESFTGTEPEYAVSVCDAVIEQWQPQQGQKVVINLPATVEVSTPNVFADSIEWFARHIQQREHIRISLHTHNDRGCAVAAAELGLMAGADRIEGTLLGNGERTGNMDIVTMGMNLYSNGVDPELDFSDMQAIIECVKYCTALPIHPRHPWAGELVYTAFSGSHQDAIRKSMKFHEVHQLEHWDVAYLPIDPRDLGRQYEEVIRINSQSGKGGVALILERDYGLELPKWMHEYLSRVVQQATEQTGREIDSEHIKQLFEQHFCQAGTIGPLKNYTLQTEQTQVQAQFMLEKRTLSGQGQGAVEALCDALSRTFERSLEITQFEQSALSGGTTAQALSCVELSVGEQLYAGAAVSTDISNAALQAVLNAFSQAIDNKSDINNPVIKRSIKR